MTLPAVSGGSAIGMMYFCCWPCVCDTMDFIRADTKTIQTADGERQYHFAVIGNPCAKPEAIPRQAPDVNCESEQLVKATISDHGYVIIGMLFEPGVHAHSDPAVRSTDQAQFSKRCQARADTGNSGGMGMIFREIATIAPISALPGGQAALLAVSAAGSPSSESKVSGDGARGPEAPDVSVAHVRCFM